MALTVYYPLLLMLTLSLSYALEYPITDNVAYASADVCAQGCAAYVWGYQVVIMDCPWDSAAHCLCNTANGYSSTMEQQMSLCAASSSCGGAAEATSIMGIFSAYCSMNIRGVAAATTSQASTVQASTVAATASTGASPANPLDTSAPSDTSSTSSVSPGASSDNENTLSMSDKIAIGCAIGGAIVTIAVAVPTWLHLRKKKRENATERQLPHGQPQIVQPHYYQPVQQPMFHQPYQQPPPQSHAFYNNGRWSLGGWK